jgi:hypothetical protein
MPDPTSPPAAPDDEALAALLARALAGGEAAEEARALAEVARDLAAIADEAAEVLGGDVRAAALAAWAVGTVGTAGEAAPDPQARPPVVRGPVSAPGPAPGPAPVPAVHLLRWAALLLAGLGLTLFAVLSSPEEATAGLRLGSLFRLDQAHGRQEASSGREIPWGERIEVGEHEVLGFRLPEGSAVVLRGAGRLRPVRAADGSPVLTLEAGALQVAVASGSEVRLALGDQRLRLRQGRAWANGSDRTFSLGPTGRARLAVAGAGDRLLEGPGTWHAAAAGSFEAAAEAPPAARFDLPSVLGADHLGRASGRLVAARQWRVVGGEARRRGTSIALEGAVVKLAWRPAPDVRRARTLRLRLEGAAGLTVGLVGDEGRAVPAGRRTDLPLPPGWYEARATPGEELVVELRATQAGARDARFLGASFVSDLADPSDDESIVAEPDPGPPRKE